MSRSTMESPQFFSKKTTMEDGRLYITPQASRVLEGNQKMWDDYVEIDIRARVDKKTTPARISIPNGMKEWKAEFVWKLVLLINRVEQETGHPIDIPYNLIFAQAILESGWGTSPAARNYHNLFGLRHADGSSMEFPSFLDGLKTYLSSLETHPRHEAFRMKLRETNNSLLLTAHLASYCDCDGYPEKLNKILQDNHLVSPG